MTGRTSSVGYLDRFSENWMKQLSFLLVSGIAFLLSACVPIGEQTVNTDLFTSKEDMRAQADALKPGMSRKAVFEKLDIEVEKFSLMSPQEIQMNIYGNSQVQGSPEQLEQFKQRMLSYQGYALPYREVKSKGSLGFGTMKVNKKGYDLRLLLIFEKDKLLRASVDGNQDVNINDDSYLWNAVLRKTTGIGF